MQNSKCNKYALNIKRNRIRGKCQCEDLSSTKIFEEFFVGLGFS
jgi:hypothetical protein